MYHRHQLPMQNLPMQCKFEWRASYINQLICINFNNSLAHLYSTISRDPKLLNIEKILAIPKTFHEECFHLCAFYHLFVVVIHGSEFNCLKREF